MLTLQASTPLRVLWRGPWSSPEATGDSRIAFRSGALVERAKLLDEASGDLFEWTLSEHINGEVKPGDLVHVTLEVRIDDRSGRPRPKFRVVDAKPAKSAASAAV
jgi:hypothetical protein